MAEQNIVKSYIAGGTITEFALVKLETDGDVVVADVATDANVIGVAQRAASSGDIVDVVVHGLTRAIVETGINLTSAVSLPVQVGATGGVDANASGGYGIGYLIPSKQNLNLAAGEQVEIIFNGPKTPLP
jgi:hypothetical protein